MKKTMFLCTIIFISSFCYSQERGRYVDVELWGGMPFISGSLDHAGNETIKTEIPFSFGIGVATYNIFRGSNFGIVILINYIFPETLLHTIDGQEIRYARNNISSLDVQLGFGYHLLGQEGTFRLPVTFGFHFFNFAGLSERTNETYQLYIDSFGIGSSVAAELHIASFVYFFFRLQGFFDFIYDASISHIEYVGYNISGRRAYFIDSREFSAVSTYFGITPSIGLGLKIDGLIP